MNRDQAINYAKTLDQLGDKVNGLSNRLNAISNFVLKDAKKSTDLIEPLEELNKIRTQYASCLTELQRITPPVEITDQHQELADVFNHFVTGTQMIIESVAINNNHNDDVAAILETKKLIEGLSLQKSGESKTVTIVNDIIRIFSEEGLF